MFTKTQPYLAGQMGVSENSGTPKSSILTGFSIINHPFWGTTVFGNTQMEKTWVVVFCFAVFENTDTITSFRLLGGKCPWQRASTALRPCGFFQDVSRKARDKRKKKTKGMQEVFINPFLFFH